MSRATPGVPFEQVLDAEAEYIDQRRKLLLAEGGTAPAGAVQETLVGLALSGGGIRSATTNLGLLQALARMGILPRVDYLCTVSGGGYIGACLSGLLSVNGTTASPLAPGRYDITPASPALFTTQWDRFPFRDERGDWPETGRDQVKHLRTHGNFLVTRKGFLTTETLRSIGGVITGVVYHWILFLLAFAILASFGLFLMLGVFGPEDTVTRIAARAPATAPASQSAAAPAARQDGAPAVAPASERFGPPAARPPGDGVRRDGATSSTAEATLNTVGEVLARSVPALQVAVKDGWMDPHGPFRRATYAGALVAVAVFALVCVGVAMPALGGWGAPKEGESAEDAFHRRLLKQIRRVGLVALGAVTSALRFVHDGSTTLAANPLGWLFLPLAAAVGFWFMGLVLYLLLPWGELAVWPRRVWSAFGHLWTRQFRSAWGSVEALGLYWIAAGLMLALFPFAVVAVQEVGVSALLTALVSAVASRGLATRLGSAPAARSWVPAGLKRALLGVLVGVFIATAVVLLGSWFIEWPPASLPFGLTSWLGRGEPYVVITLGALALLSGIGIVGNSNKIGLHYFYRDRLIETFLRTEATGDDQRLHPVHDAMNLTLKELHGVHVDPTRPDGQRDYTTCATSAPYLLVSCAINLAERRDLTRKDRKSGYFTFSKLYCGSWHTGYRATTDYQAGGVKLSRAMTISGAAVGSGMGYHTFFAQAFAATLFNVRLGYWMENPRWRPRLLQSRAERPIFSPWWLLHEMLSWTHGRGRLVNLSDGGHTGDNVGIYPLLQRRCTVIVACDAEADPDVAFGSFTEALRHAYIDLNVDVDIDLTMIRRDPVTGRSRSHCAVGRIRYPETERSPASTGWLIYLKSSLTGDEPEPMKNYHAANAAFPHETTADQFFDDAQFESYRALGYHLAEHAFLRARDAGPAFSPPWLDRMLRAHASFKAVDDPDYWRATAALAKIEEELTGTPALRWYYDECYPGPKSRTPAVAPDPRPSVTGLVLKQARLMEQVYLSLALDRSAHAPDNRGWMNVFRAWSHSPTFRQEFAAVSDLFVADFVSFYRHYIEGRQPIEVEPIPHPWDGAVPKGAPRIFLDPGRR